MSSFNHLGICMEHASSQQWKIHFDFYIKSVILAETSTYVEDWTQSQKFTSELFSQFFARKLLSEMYRRNSKYGKNNKFNKDCKL